MEPSPAKTKMKVEMNSAKVALMESGWVASSALPTAYRLGGIVAATVTTTNKSSRKLITKIQRNHQILRFLLLQTLFLKLPAKKFSEIGKLFNLHG